MDDFSKPMMSESEIKLIDDLIEEKKPKKVLEWGSGGSTVYFPNKHSCIEKWISIEHSERFVNYIKRYLSNKVELKQVKLHEYLSSVPDMKFDMILVDGLMRAECIMFSDHLLSEDGFLLLHDSGREEYRKLIKERKAVKLAEGEVKMTSFAHRGLHLFTQSNN